MLPCLVKSRLHSRQGSPRSSCVSPMSTLDSYSGIPIPSGLLTSFSSNIPTFKPANLPTFFDLSPLLPVISALFCRFLHPPKTQLFSFHTLPHSFTKKGCLCFQQILFPDPNFFRIRISQISNRGLR